MFFLKQLLLNNKACLGIIFIIGLLSLGYYLYNKGYSTGSEYIQNQWNLEKETTKKTMLELELKYNAEKEAFTIIKERELNELKEQLKNHEHNASALAASLNSKLQQSESRSTVYKRKAESSDNERRSLAVHTARLDKALTEGIELVEELTGLIKLRDDQLRFIRKYLEDTHALLGK